ncbi:hypothetical protein KAZ57_02115 [Patescibacteria group bacterium]|nr:hypothetical protein [Patescibacteria group bacterium]
MDDTVKVLLGIVLLILSPAICGLAMFVVFIGMLIWPFIPIPFIIYWLVRYLIDGSWPDSSENQNALTYKPNEE